ncbi:MAG TPA: hypothetical protein VI197_22650, partial [Polyangiaceae bacterium]
MRRQLQPPASSSPVASTGAPFVAAAVLLFVEPRAVAPAPPTELPLVVELGPPTVAALPPVVEVPPTVSTLAVLVE